MEQQRQHGQRKRATSSLYRWLCQFLSTFVISMLTVGEIFAEDVVLRHPGMYYDEETGLYYIGQRFYDPKIGQYIQPDRIGLAGGLNVYRYVDQNPLRYIDPTGESPQVVGAFLGFVSGGIGAYMTSGGDRWEALNGALIGAGVGFVNPLKGLPNVSAFVSSFSGSVFGQLYGSCASSWRKKFTDIDFSFAAASGVAGFGGRRLTTYLSNPRRTAFTATVEKRLGSGSPVAEGLWASTIEGFFEGGILSSNKSRESCDCM